MAGFTRWPSAAVQRLKCRFAAARFRARMAVKNPSVPVDNGRGTEEFGQCPVAARRYSVQTRGAGPIAKLGMTLEKRGNRGPRFRMAELSTWHRPTGPRAGMPRAILQQSVLGRLKGAQPLRM